MVFRIAKDHTLPKLLYQCIDGNGCPIDLSEADSVKFSLIKQDRANTVFVDEAEASLSQNSSYPASEGWVEYSFSESDTEYIEFYYGRFHIIFDTKKAAFPTQLEALEIYVERI